MCPSEVPINPAQWTDRVVSGRYYGEFQEDEAGSATEAPWSGSGPPPRGAFRGISLNLDVDGWFFLDTFSAEVTFADGRRAHLIVPLKRLVTPIGARVWTGEVRELLGHDLRPPLQAVLEAKPPPPTRPWRVHLTFRWGPSFELRAQLTRRYDHFHPLDLWFDYTADAGEIYLAAKPLDPNCEAKPGVTEYPPGEEKLNVADVYARAGFGVTCGHSSGPVSDDRRFSHDDVWTDEELHNAMEEYWKPGGLEYAEAPRWAMWCLFTGEYYDSPEPAEASPVPGTDPSTGPVVCSLGTTSVIGIMFDVIGEAQRQGAAVFLRPFSDWEIRRAEELRSANVEDPEVRAKSERQRRQFFTLVHELGHCLNLAHSWAKSEGAPWRHLEDDPQAASFMNRPELVAGGEDEFWKGFVYNFTDDELLFLRHAPERFVKTGLAPWFDDHGLTLDVCRPIREGLTLRLATGRPSEAIAFLEPLCLQLELRNVSAGTAVIDPAALLGGDGLTLVIKRDGQPARLFWPHLKPMYTPMILAEGEAAFGDFFASAGVGGWLVGEPGAYTAQACLRVQGGSVLSEPLRFTVGRGSARQEAFAGDWFQPAVARALAVGGCRSPGLAPARRVFEQATAEWPESLLAVHARYLLASGAGRVFKRLRAKPSDPPGKRPSIRVERLAADPGLERERMRAVLLDPRAADAMGFMSYARRVRRHSRWLRGITLAAEGDAFSSFLSAEAARRGAGEQLRYLDRLLGGGGAGRTGGS